MVSKVSAGKSTSKSDSETGSTTPKKLKQQISPPLFPTANSARGRHTVFPNHWNPTGGKLSLFSVIPEAPNSQERSNDEEWKNVRVILSCILCIVEKTQHAISILQQRQTTAANIRTTDEIVAYVKEKAKADITEVKQASLKEMKRASGDSIEVKSELRNLGVLLSNNLSFSVHIDNSVAAGSKLV